MDGRDAVLGNNGHLKLLALTLTIVLHFFVLAEKETTRELTLAVEIGSAPAGYVALNEAPNVRVTIRGSARAFARLDEDALRRVIINVNDVEEERREIRETDLGLPSHFDVEAVSPRWVELELDEIVERELPIRAVIRGTPARGFEATDPMVSPPTIIVSAPSSYFPEFDAVFTEGIDIQNLDHPLTQDVDLSIQRPYVTFPDDTEISVTLNVAALIESRTLEGVALRVTGPDSDLCSVDVHSISVTVAGPKTLVDALEPRSILATVHCSTFAEQGPGLYTPAPTIKNLAESMIVESTDPQVLQLEVSERPEPVPEPPEPTPPEEGPVEFEHGSETDEGEE